MIIITILFFITAILYASVGFGGGSTYLALMLIWEIPYYIFPIIALFCNIIVVSGNSINFIRSGNINLKLNNLRTARKSNYNFFQKVLIFLFSTEKFINKILVITFSLITLILFLIMVYGGYLLYNYFIIGFKGYPGWLSNVLLSLITI